MDFTQCDAGMDFSSFYEGGYEHLLYLNSGFRQQRPLDLDLSSELPLHNFPRRMVNVSLEDNTSHSADPDSPCRLLWDVVESRHGFPRNTGSLRLDDDPATVLKNFEKMMIHLKLWYCSVCGALDVSDVLGFQKMVYMAPDDEHSFYLSLLDGDRSLTLVIDPATGWLFGTVGHKRIIQFKRDDFPYIVHPYSTVLKSTGIYGQIAPSGVGNVKLGLEPLRQAFEIIVNSTGSTESSELLGAFGTIVEHFLEPLKFHRSFEIVLDALLTGTTTYNLADRTVAVMFKNWGNLSTPCGRYIFSKISGKPASNDLRKFDVEGINTVQDFMKETLIVPRAFIPRQFLEAMRTREPHFWSPVDPGIGDENVIPLRDPYEATKSLTQLSSADLRFLAARERYFGNRTGGSVFPGATAFLSQRSAHSDISSWWHSTASVVRNRRIEEVARLSMAVLRRFGK